MAVRLSGLVSGLDTDSIVQELVSAYSQKKTSLEKSKTKLEWKQDAWKDMNTKIYSLYSGSLSNMRFSNAFNKKVSSSTSNKATVTATSDAVLGTQTLKINSLAKTGYLTGGVVKSESGKAVTGSSKLSELGITDSSISVTSGGKTKDVEITEDMTVDKFVAQLKQAGLNASFDEKNQRFFVSSKTSGKDGDFNLNGNSTEGVNTLKSLGLYITTDSDSEMYEKMANYDVDALTDTAYEKQKKAYLDAETATKNLTEQVESLTKQNEELSKKKETLQFKQEYAGLSNDEKNARVTSMNDRIQEIKDMDRSSMTEEEKKALTEEQTALEAKVAAAKEVDTAIGSETLTEEDRQVYMDKLAEELTTTTDTLAENEATIAKNEAVLAGGMDAYLEEENGKIDTENAELKDKLHASYEAKKALGQEMTEANNIVKNYASLENPTDEETEAYNAALAKLGKISGGSTGAVRIEGADASITLNGAEFKANTNSFSINGLTINANAVTDPDEEIVITTNQDTDGIYDMVKNFLKDYNELIKEMDEKYNATSAKGYEPLSDEEKEQMTDDQIEKWETKVKDALLRRDQTLDNVASAMKTAMSKSFTINGKSYSLASFGISTLSYFSSGDNEKGVYHIDGDKDDSSTSGNSDKLRSMIASDPETVATFFNKLAEEVYTTLSNKMKSSSVSSAYTVYNDKQMKKEYDDYDDKIDDWNDKIEKYEERYRKQFSAMETALEKLNSQTSQLTGLLGG